MARYANETTVDPKKTRMDIEKVLERYGATGFAFATEDNRSMIQFQTNERRVRFILTEPDREEFKKTETGLWRDSSVIDKAWQQGIRSLWRALLLMIKAKLEAVESGIVTFDEEFMAHLLLPNGQTVGERALPEIAQWYRTGKMPSLLPAPVDGAQDGRH